MPEPWRHRVAEALITTQRSARFWFPFRFRSLPHSLCKCSFHSSQFTPFAFMSLYFHHSHSSITKHTQICISVMNISLYIYHNSHRICLNRILGVESENGYSVFVSVRVFSVEWTVIFLWHVCENLKAIFVCAWTGMTNKYSIKCRPVHLFL